MLDPVPRRNRALASRLGNLVLPAIINPFMAPFRRDRRRLHDIPANTVVVRKLPSDEDQTAISAPPGRHSDTKNARRQNGRSTHGCTV